MTKEELWTIYCTRNPQFAGTDTITIRSEGLKKLFDQTWEMAHNAGVANGRALAAQEQSGNPFNSFFGWGK